MRTYVRSAVSFVMKMSSKMQASDVTMMTVEGGFITGALGLTEIQALVKSSSALTVNKDTLV